MNSNYEEHAHGQPHTRSGHLNASDFSSRRHRNPDRRSGTPDRNSDVRHGNDRLKRKGPHAPLHYDLEVPREITSKYNPRHASLESICPTRFQEHRSRGGGGVPSYISRHQPKDAILCEDGDRSYSHDSLNSIEQFHKVENKTDLTLNKLNTLPGLYCCSDCGTQDSPKWRNGPNGKTSLCNACGLRWARLKLNVKHTLSAENESGTERDPTETYKCFRQAPVTVRIPGEDDQLVQALFDECVDFNFISRSCIGKWNLNYCLEPIPEKHQSNFAFLGESYKPDTSVTLELKFQSTKELDLRRFRIVDNDSFELILCCPVSTKRKFQIRSNASSPSGFVLEVPGLESLQDSRDAQIEPGDSFGEDPSDTESGEDSEDDDLMAPDRHVGFGNCHEVFIPEYLRSIDSTYYSGIEYEDDKDESSTSDIGIPDILDNSWAVSRADEGGLYDVSYQPSGQFIKSNGSSFLEDATPRESKVIPEAVVEEHISPIVYNNARGRTNTPDHNITDSDDSEDECSVSCASLSGTSTVNLEDESLWPSIIESTLDDILDLVMDEFWALVDNSSLSQNAGGTGGSSRSGDVISPFRSDPSLSNSRKRKASSIEEDQNEKDAEDREPPGKRLANPGVDDEIPLFACPFRKHNPREYGRPSTKYRLCISGWATISRLKEHIYRKHKIPPHCPRCWSSMENRERLDQHMRADPICETSFGYPPDGITPEMETKLRSRKKCKANASSGDAWREMYQLLFPHKAEIPSPYIDMIPEEFPASPNALQLADFESHIRRALPDLVRSTIAARYSFIEASILREMPDIVRSCLSDLFREYSARNNLDDGTFRIEQIQLGSAFSTNQQQETPATDQPLAGFFQPPEQQNTSSVPTRDELVRLSGSINATSGAVEIPYSDSGYASDIICICPDENCFCPMSIHFLMRNTLDASYGEAGDAMHANNFDLNWYPDQEQGYIQ